MSSTKKARKKERRRRPDPGVWSGVGPEEVGSVERRLVGYASCIDLATEGGPIPAEAVALLTQIVIAARLGEIARHLTGL